MGAETLRRIRMQLIERGAVHIRAVIRGVLFIGLTIRILLGLAWMVCNFTQVQDFGEPDSALYGGLFKLAGEIPQILYLLQLVAAFFAGFVFLGGFRRTAKSFALWGGLALLTFPFAMQCHLALQPYSLMGTLLLVIFFILLGGPGGFQKTGKPCGCSGDEMPGTDGRPNGKAGKKKSRRQLLGSAAIVLGCVGMIAGLSGWADVGKRGEPAGSFASAMASRFAWPSMLSDWEQWPEELQSVTENVLWEASFAPGNWKLLEEAIESSADAETAKEWYRKIAGIGWKENTHAVIGQMGWDGLGYIISPVVVRMQLEGGLYDSCTGRNYEVMRTHAPILTRIYVDYECWWFPCSICLTLLLTLFSAGDADWPAAVRKVCACIGVAGIAVLILVLRGAGVMDYRYTIAVNELWLIWTLFLMSRKESERKMET